MMHNLFYVPANNINDEKVQITDKSEIHHLKHVLRIKKDDIIFITDGIGHRYKVQIHSLSKSLITCDIIERDFFEKFYNLNLSLAFVPLKGTRDGILIEKCTELGVISFLPFISKHGVVQRISDNRVKRYRKLSINAMLQSQQYYCPAVFPLESVRRLVDQFKHFDQVCVTCKNGQQDIPTEQSSMLIVVGPEGGFADGEMEAFRNQGVHEISLGQSRLRSETAAITGTVKVLNAYREI